MWKRMWKANLIFTFLFWLSFSLTFCIVYYGMFLKSQIQQVNTTAEQMNYEYRGYYSVTWSDDIADRLGIKPPELNQGILSYRLSVNNGEDIVGVKSAYLVMEMYENLMEPLEEGTYFVEEEEYDYPQCIVGDAWLKYAEENGGTTLINVNGYNCKVTGIFKSNTLAGSDDRIYLYGPSMSRDFLEDLIWMNESMSVDYRVLKNVDYEQVEKYKSWLDSGIFEDVQEDDMEMVDGGVTGEFTAVIPVYNKFFIFMMVFCFANCAFLTYVWCSRKVQENMIKRVFGFNIIRIWWDGLKEIALYEGISIITSSMICMVIEICRGNVANFFTTWKYGVGVMVTVLLIFTFFLSLINVLYLKKLKPADTLKAVE